MKYDVVKQAVPYKFDEGFIANETVTVTFYNEDNLQVETVEFGYLTKEELLSIKNDYPNFKLKNLYFSNFSIKEYYDIFDWDHDKNLCNFYAERCFFDGNSNFSSVRFGRDGFSLAYSFFGNGKVEFQKSIFLADVVHFNGIRFGTGEKDFSFSTFVGKDIRFFGTQFGNGKVNFRGSSLVNAHLDFGGALFGKCDVEFDYSFFGINGVDFSSVNFGQGEISFRNVHFNNGNIIFFGSIFGEGMLSFSGAILGEGNIDFSYCQFDKCNIHFKHITFGHGKFNMSNMNLNNGYILFKSAEFKGKVINFSESSINKLIFINSLFIGHVNMRLKQCKKLNLENCIIEKTFDLNSTTKRPVNIECLSILNTKNLGQIYIDWRMNRVKSMIYAQGKSTNYQEKSNQFRLLKENFHDIGRYNDEDFAYLEFKRCESIYKLKGGDLVYQKNKKFRKIIRHIFFPFKWFILDFVGNYATNPIRIVGTMMLTVIIFAGIFTMPFVKLDGDKLFLQSIDNIMLHRFLQGLYHSIATILTIGYGDVNPGNVSALLLSGIEGFLGLFLMSYFTVAFVRKILR